MFAAACSTARQFTHPVIMFRKTVAGKCSASIGSLVVVNADGWIVTAGHIISMAIALMQSERDALKYYSDRQAILDDGSLSSGKKNKALGALGTAKKDATHRASIHWGFPDAQLVDITLLNEIDLAVGRLQPFDPAWVSTFPTFKNPAQDFETGTSLCKYGFPFHESAQSTSPDMGMSPGATGPRCGCHRAMAGRPR